MEVMLSWQHGPENLRNITNIWMNLCNQGWRQVWRSNLPLVSVSSGHQQDTCWTYFVNYLLFSSYLISSHQKMFFLCSPAHPPSYTPHPTIILLSLASSFPPPPLLITSSGFLSSPPYFVQTSRWPAADVSGNPSKALKTGGWARWLCVTMGRGGGGGNDFSLKTSEGNFVFSWNQEKHQQQVPPCYFILFFHFPWNRQKKQKHILSADSVSVVTYSARFVAKCFWLSNSSPTRLSLSQQLSCKRKVMSQSESKKKIPELLVFQWNQSVVPQMIHLWSLETSKYQKCFPSLSYSWVSWK